MIPEPIRKAGRILASGGVVAYPTEGVFGLGCVPESLEGAARILIMKKRSAEAGMLLIASHPRQLDPWVAADVDTEQLASSPGRPVTWVVKAGDRVPWWIRGRHPGVAVRVTTHPVAAALCDAAGSALVSTSANVSGRPPARNRYVLRRQFRKAVDAIVPGTCGRAAGPSEIRDLSTGDVLRPGSS